jgi:hypothetical protein
MSMKNSTETIWDRTNDLLICSTAPQPLCHRGPPNYVSYQINGAASSNVVFLVFAVELYVTISCSQTQSTNSPTLPFWKIYGFVFVEKRPDLWPHKYSRHSVIQISGQIWARYSATYFIEPIPVAARSKARNCGRLLVWLVGSNLAGGMVVCLLWVLCVVM